MYISTVPKLYRMLRHPKMMAQFCVTNVAKFSLDKLTGDNVFLEKAKYTNKAAGRPFVHNEKFNEILKHKISSKEPFFCCRYGATEITSCFYALIKSNKILDEISEATLKKAKTSSGVFPEKADVYLNFADTYMCALGNADMNAYWGSVLMEEYMIDQTMSNNCIQYAMRALEPFQYDEPWTKSIRGGGIGSASFC